MLVVAQEVLADPVNLGGAVERLGVAGLIVLGCVYLVRYLFTLLERKDARLNEMGDRFLAATEEHTRVTEQFIAEQQRVTSTLAGMAEAIKDLRGAINILSERREHPR